jgi:hypothetical protein
VHELAVRAGASDRGSSSQEVEVVAQVILLLRPAAGCYHIDRMLDIDMALDDRPQYGKIAAAQDHAFSSSNVISNGYGEVYE